MKKIIIVLFTLFAFTSCFTKWEYKIVNIERSETSEFQSQSFNVSDEDLNLFGKDGWELVDVYVTTETEFPNFGNSEYVTGIRTNTRTQSVNYVFKRKM